MRRLKLLTLIVVGLLVQAGLGSSYAAAPRIALVIGNSAYWDSPLANPANDARLMAETLRGLGFEVNELADADQRAMKIAILDFGDRLEAAGQDAIGLFYYAGHGLQVGDRKLRVNGLLRHASRMTKFTRLPANSICPSTQPALTASTATSFSRRIAEPNGMRKFRSPT